MYILVYIDDIILVSNNSAHLATFFHSLVDWFLVKDLKALTYFLGVEVTSSSDGLFVTQYKYIHDLLMHTGMFSAKDVSTPLSTSISLTFHDRTNLSNARKYHTIIGSFQYHSHNCSYVAYIVNYLLQFMHKSINIPWLAVKRLLCYLKCKFHHGPFLKCKSLLFLHAFSDVD